MYLAVLVAGLAIRVWKGLFTGLPAVQFLPRSLAAQSMQFAFENRDNQSGFQSVKSVEMEGYGQRSANCAIFSRFLFVVSELSTCKADKLPTRQCQTKGG